MQCFRFSYKPSVPMFVFLRGFVFTALFYTPVGVVLFTNTRIDVLFEIKNLAIVTVSAIE